MIEIAISGELAAECRGFVGACRERGHQVEVFVDGDGVSVPEPAEADEPRELPNEAYIGHAHPEKGWYAACSETFSTDPDDFCSCPICQTACRRAGDV